MAASNWASAIRSAREFAGLSPAQVAARAGLAEARVDALEHDGADATMGELYAVTRALRLDLESLLRGEVRRDAGASLAFRSRDAGWAALSEADLRACERALRAGRSLLEVNERLGRPRSTRWTVEAGPPSADVEVEVRDRARAVRDILGNPEGRLPDLVSVLESLDVVVEEHAFSSLDVDAVAVMEAAGVGGAAVLVSSASPAWRSGLRRRVLLAHELCHVLLDRGEEVGEAVVDFDVEASQDAGASHGGARYVPQALPRERRARAFAAEFLMPTAALRSLFGAPQGVHDFGDAARMVDVVRDQFETPVEIALNHLWNRRYLGPIPHLSTEDPRVDLLEYIRWKRGWAPKPRSEAPPAIDLLPRRVEEAWRADRCTDAEARRWLGLSRFEDLPWTAQA